MFYFVQLPVFGQMGSRTVLDTNVHPPNVIVFHCLLDSIPTSQIWRIFPCIIVDQAFAQLIREHSYGGLQFQNGLFEPGDSFHHFHGDAKVIFNLLVCNVSGVSYKDDFGLADKSKLIVSERAKHLIECVQHDGVSFTPVDVAPTADEIARKIWEDAAKVAKELRATAKLRKL